MERYNAAKAKVAIIEKQRSKNAFAAKIITTVLMITVFLINAVQGVDEFMNILPSPTIFGIVSAILSGAAAVFDFILSWRHPRLKGRSEYLMHVLEEIRVAEVCMLDTARHNHDSSENNPTISQCIINNAEREINELMKLLTYDNSMNEVISRNTSEPSHI
jgi:hypothetical protein